MALIPYEVNLGALRDSDTSGGTNYYIGEVINITDLNDTNVPLFSDRDGNVPLPQNNISNVTDGSGVFAFFVASGSYKIKSLGSEKLIDLGGSESESAILSLTLADAIAKTDAVIGQRVLITDRDNGEFLYEELNSPTGNGTISATGSGLQLSIQYDGYLNVRWFTSVRGGASVITSAMQEAHDTGLVVDYPSDRYLFGSVSMNTGGITGRGRDSILLTNDTSSLNVITHNCKDPDSILINERGFVFKDFTLRASTNNIDQKSTGAGIRVQASAPENENYTGTISGVTIRNIPTSFSSSLCSFMEIKDNYFAFFKESGIYCDMDNAIFEDNGDNAIISNEFYTRSANAICVNYRCGGGRIGFNKMNGGIIGVDINPLRSSSVMVVNDNSIENQTINSIRFITSGTDSVAFGRMTISNNQLNAVSAAGSSITLNSTDYTLREIAIVGNQIAHNSASNIIDIRGTQRFTVSANECYGNGVSLYGIYCDPACSDGYISGNFIDGTSLNQDVNVNSSSIVVDHVESINKYTAEVIPQLLDGEKHEIAKAIPRCELGDEVIVTYEADSLGLNIHGWVYAQNAVKVWFSNNTGATVAALSANLRVKVKNKGF